MKRILAVLMALMMVLSFAACKGNDTTSSSIESALDSAQATASNTAADSASNTDASNGSTDSSNESTEALPSNTQTTPHSAVTSGTVIDALTYSKEVTVAKGVNAKDYENQMHVVAVPKISKDSKNAEKFNNKIYNATAAVYENLKANKEEKIIYNIGYEYKEYNDIVAVMVLNNTTIQGGSTSFVYNAYYYDLKKDKELSYKEYLKSVGLSEKKIKTAAEATREFGEMQSMVSDKEKVYVKDCLVDAQSAILFINNPNEEGGWWRIDTGSLF